LGAFTHQASKEAIMAFGPENFNLTIVLHSVFCFYGDDNDDFFSNGYSEPYLWVIMIKIDGEGLHQDGNFLVGEAKFFFSPGSHGNIGGPMGGGSRRIPAAVGRWQTSLKPIPISVVGQQLTTIPGVILCCAVLMEENLTPNSAVEAGHQSLNNLVKTTVANTIASMGLAGLAADSAAEVALQASQGNTITLATAAQQTLNRRLKPVQDLFTVAAPANLVVTILQNLNLGGFLGTAIDRDKPMGVFFQLFSQAELARTFESAPGLPAGYGLVDINSHMWNIPEWAYTLHGAAYAHRKFVRRAPPANNRLQVTCTSKRRLMSGEKRISGIGGVDNGSSWVLSRGEAADLIRSGQKTFFVAGPDNHTVDVIAEQGGFTNGRPWFYLVTPADHIKTNNLLELPDCPAGGTEVEIWY
jgi:hypothetical protein